MEWKRWSEERADSFLIQLVYLIKQNYRNEQIFEERRNINIHCQKGSCDWKLYGENVWKSPIKDLRKYCAFWSEIWSICIMVY